MRRWTARGVAAAAGVLIGLVVAGPAYPHVEVTAEPAVAGAGNAVVTLSAEAESAAAGIASVRVVLPAGIDPTGVALANAPAGWTLTRAADGYTVGGPALPTGQQAVHSITVNRLPDTTRLVFKVLVTYSDGTVERWIEEPTAANPEPDNPAAVLDLRPGPSAPASPPAVPAAAASVPATAAAAAPPAADSGRGGSWLLWWSIPLVLLVGAASAVLALRRRHGRAADAG